MGSARREIKIVAVIALLAVSVAVAAAIFLSMNLSGEVDAQRARALGLSAQVAALTERVDIAREEAEDADRATADLKGGYKQCQKAVEITEEFVDALFDIGPGSTEASFDDVDDLATRANKATAICMAGRVELIDTY